MNLNKNIIGNSHGNHNIKSAEPTPCNETDKSGPFYVYVGRLSPDTSEQSLRTHLDGIGVTNINVTDVIKLNSRNENQSSFCITLSSKASKNLMFSPENWPAGIMIRPYIQKNTQSRNQNKSTRQYYDDPPGLGIGATNNNTVMHAQMGDIKVIHGKSVIQNVKTITILIMIKIGLA